MELTYDQIKAYWEIRHPGQNIGTGNNNKASVRCIFHDDRNPSCTLFLDGAGGFHCNGCGAGGNIFQFESRHSGCTVREAGDRIAALTGAKPSVRVGGSALGLIVALHDYRSAGADKGTVLFQKVRYEPKDFRLRHRDDVQDPWVWNLAGIQPVLYNLPQVVTANVVIIVEGEKDSDRLTHARPFHQRGEWRVAVTCTCHGAWKPGEKSKWLPSYNPYFAGKMVIVLPDNDPPGEAYATGAAAAVFPYADMVKIIRLPGLPEHGDVSDWLDAGHTVKELEAEIKKAPAWQPTETESHVLVTAPEFIAATTEDINWLVNRVIPKGGNGFIVAVTKGRKSWSAVDLLISMALGEPWLGFGVPNPVRCALVTREDTPSLTAWRMGHLFRGKRAKHPELLETNLYVNSRAQTSQFMLDNPAQVAELVAEFRKRRIEFAVFDVFNVMHSVDENDNTKMRAILQELSNIQTEVGCSIGVVHHFGKIESASLVQRMRGASAIAGWAEWLIGLSPEDEESGTIKVEFKSKASAQTPPVYFEIESGNGVANLRTVDQPARKQGGRRPLSTIGQERDRRDLQ
jgi:hypothetical protein